MLGPLPANPSTDLLRKTSDHFVIHVFAFISDLFLPPAMDASEISIEQQLRKAYCMLIHAREVHIAKEILGYCSHPHREPVIVL